MVVSGEFATGNGLALLTAPMTLNLFPAGATPSSTGEVNLGGYVCNFMALSRRVRGTHVMVATLKRPPSRGRLAFLASGHLVCFAMLNVVGG